MRLFYVLMLLPMALAAQPRGWQEITISDGLSQGMIYDLKQDCRGFIWAGTKDGLNRYDGHNFKVFTHDPYDNFSLSDNECSALLIDRRGWLWVGTLNHGLNLFDNQTQRFYHIDISDEAATNAGNYEIQLLTEDPDGHIWVGTDKNKLLRISLPPALQDQLPDQPNLTSQVQRRWLALPPTAKSGGNPYSISFQPGGDALLGGTFGLYSFNWRKPANITQTRLFINPPAEVVGSFGDPGRGFWLLATDDKIVCVQRGVQKTIPVLAQNNFGVVLKAVDQNTLAIATRDYLWLMSPDDLMRQDSLTARNALLTFPNNIYAITNVLKDRTGTIWLGTSGYGLRKFSPGPGPFRTYLPNTTLSAIYPDRQGRIYIRYQFSYGQLDRATNRLVPFLSNSLPPADQRQRYLMQDRRGYYWVSNVNFETHVQHLFKFSPDWQLLKKYPLPANTSFGFYNNCTIEDAAGHLWLGATNGKILRFDPSSETFRVFSYQSLLPQNGAEIETTTLYIDGPGTLWAGTQQGLVRVVNPQQQPVFSLYKNASTDRRSLSNNVVSSVIDDPYQPDRFLWVATKGGGLERLDKQTGQFAHFTEAQGLPNKVVYGILVDEFRNLWLSTNRGLAQFNPKTGQFHNYTKADGLQDDEFNTGSFARMASGELLFGGVNGLTAFRASAVGRATNQNPLVNIIGLKINNKPVEVRTDGILSRAIEHTERIDLAHDQNLVTLEFGVMDYTNSAKNRYRYRLNGIDGDWVEAGTSRFANYAQLPDGDYTFQVMGSPDGEVWSPPVELRIRVHPPFYRSWWAYCLYLLALLSIGWELYRFQTQRLLLQQQLVFEQHQASRLAELDTLKTQFFANISHEFRTPLTLILGPLSMLKRRFPTESSLELMERNAHRLLSLINQLLDLSKLEAGQLQSEPEPGDLAGFLRLLASSFHSLAESRSIHFSFVQTPVEWWSCFDRDKLEKIVANLLSNAIKFTPANQSVTLTVDYRPHGPGHQVVITVADTGIGIAPAHLARIFERFYQASTTAADGHTSPAYEGTGIGLALVNELVRVLGGTITVKSTEGVGTTFTVMLPLEPMPTPLTAPAAEAAPKYQPDGGRLPVLAPPTEWAEPTGAEKVLLVIDDNADIRAYVRTVFADDYRVIEATDGEEGLATATATLPDLVICDLMMPRLDGFGFCRHLKSQEATSHIPVMMLTAKATTQDRIEGFELGADDYLTKPFNQDEIRARVRNLIGQREQLYRQFASRQTAPAVELTEPGLPSAEQKFIDRLINLIEQHLDEVGFGVEALAEATNLSRVQLHRKLKALTNTTPTSFIRQIRLAKAAELLAEGEQSVTQVAYMVGFDNLSYFAKVFQEHFGVLPSHYGKATASH